MKQLQEFVHLGIRSEYTILNSILKLDDILNKAVQVEMPFIGIADINNMFGCYSFEKMCSKYSKNHDFKINNLIGVTFAVQNPQSYYCLTLYAQNTDGYRELVELSTRANTGNKPLSCITMEDLAQVCTSNCICLTGGCAGELFQYVIHHQESEARAYLQTLKTIFKNNIYIELTHHFLPDEKIFLESDLIPKFCNEFGIDVVATNHVFYKEKSHSFHRAIALEMNSNPNNTEIYTKYVNYNDEFYFKSQQEMAEAFKDYLPKYPTAFSNTIKIAALCKVKVPKERALPQYPLPDGYTSETYLEELIWKGFNKRFPTQHSFAEGFKRQDYIDRLEYEFETIKTMGFVDYFIIVQDFINFAKDKEVYKHPEVYFPKNHYKREEIPDELWNKNYEIFVGPGRGSAAGSLLAYCLSITEGLDPIKNRLLFERFLNVERVSMPDIDIDFSNAHRQVVVQYVQVKYGYSHVSQIVTFQTMQVKKIIKSVGKTLGLPFSFTNEMTANVPFCLKNGNEEIPITSLNQLRNLDYFKHQLAANEDVQKLFEIGIILEGLPSATSKHAAGVIIGRKALSNYLPLMEVDGVMVTQFEKGSCEEIGLLKMDFLGLKTLDILQKTLELVEQQTGKKISLYDIPQEDAATYNLLKSGNTGKVFQIESEGMTDLFIKMQPKTFEDINAAIALYRPGPMAFIPDYLKNRQNPTEIVYPHPLFKDVTATTYGILIYQEQIMEVVQKLAGFTLGHADILRKAISKKQKDMIAEEKKLFIKGCKDVNNISEEDACFIFEQIEPFANYGFNRSHSAAYGILSYDTAYCKAHYPECFLAANLTIASQDSDDLAYTLAVCKKNDIPVLPPHYSHSDKEFTLEQIENNRLAIRYSYAAIKSIGEGVAEKLTTVRSAVSLGDFINQLPCTLNTGQITHLIQAGTFDDFGSRKAMVQALPELIEYTKTKKAIEKHLPTFLDAIDFKPKYDGPEYSKIEKMDYERNALSIILSGHPVEAVRNMFPQYKNTLIDIIMDTEASSEPQEKVTVLCTIDSVKVITTKAGSPMAFMTLSDEFYSMEGLMFPKTYIKFQPLLEINQPLLITGNITFEIKEGFVKYTFIVESIEPAVKSFKIYIHKNTITPDCLTSITQENGIASVYLVDSKTLTITKTPYKIDFNQSVIDRLTNENVEYLSYQ